MIVLEACNVNDALAQGARFIREHGVREESRNGPVLRVPEPVTTVYFVPEERVLFAPGRDANPFFHLIESIWMIAGRDRLSDLTPYVSTFGQFSDDGVTVPGAYGKRWRGWFVDEDDQTFDQLDWAVKRLRNDPTDRRVVIQMWDANIDPGRADNGGKDVPCNLELLPKIVDGTLDVTVFCRSNDMLLGAYGANAVHFSFLQEYLAGRIGVPVGVYRQISVDFHVYEADMEKFDLDALAALEGCTDFYAEEAVEQYPIFKGWGGEDHSNTHPINDAAREQVIAQDLALFFDEGPEVANRAARWPFLKQIAAPMALAHRHWKGGKGEDRFVGALEILKQMPERNDWRRACEEWINRRYVKWVKANADIVSVP